MGSATNRRTGLTSLDLHFLVGELQKIVSAKIDKIYQPEPKEILIQLHVPNEGKKLLLVRLPDFIFLTDLKQDQPERPSGFAMGLRKRLQNARIREIGQHAFERVVVLQLESLRGEDGQGQKEAKSQHHPIVYYLVAELFSKGNLVLCDENYRIIAVQEEQFWKGRPLKKGETYNFPAKKYNFLELSENELGELLAESGRDSLVKTLAIELSLGGDYAEQLCALAAIDKSKKSIDETEIKRLFAAIQKLRSPTQAENRGRKAMESCMESYYSSKAGASSAKSSGEAARIEKMIAMQKEKIAGLQLEIGENSRKAELIYGNYQLVNALLNGIKEARKSHSWKEIAEKLKGHKVIRKIDEKTGRIDVEI
jgi:predicted ribosome quality control (RQC) complex YloA/Tae2 family protein